MEAGARRGRTCYSLLQVRLESSILILLVSYFLRAAALAANCRVKIESSDKETYYELRQNPALGISFISQVPSQCLTLVLFAADEFESVFIAKYGTIFEANFGASTDFVRQVSIVLYNIIDNV